MEDSVAPSPPLHIAPERAKIFALQGFIRALKRDDKRDDILYMLRLAMDQELCNDITAVPGATKKAVADAHEVSTATIDRNSDPVWAKTEAEKGYRKRLHRVFQRNRDCRMTAAEAAECLLQEGGPFCVPPGGRIEDAVVWADSLVAGRKLTRHTRQGGLPSHYSTEKIESTVWGAVESFDILLGLNRTADWFWHSILLEIEEILSPEYQRRLQQHRERVERGEAQAEDYERPAKARVLNLSAQVPTGHDMQALWQELHDALHEILQKYEKSLPVCDTGVRVSITLSGTASEVLR